MMHSETFYLLLLEHETQAGLGDPLFRMLLDKVYINPFAATLVDEYKYNSPTLAS